MKRMIAELVPVYIVINANLTRINISARYLLYIVDKRKLCNERYLGDFRYRKIINFEKRIMLVTTHYYQF